MAMSPKGRVARLALLGGLLVLAPIGLKNLGTTLDPYRVDTSNAYIAPTLAQPFGTDGLGRSQLARTAFAAGLSLQVVSVSIAISFTLALVLGGIAGYWTGRWPDLLISWIISLLFSVPFLLIVVAIFAVLTPTLARTYIVIGCIGWAAPARIIRAEVRRLRSAPFVLASRAYGWSARRIVATSLVPLAATPGFIALLYFTPELIGLEVGLAFFGLGAAPPTPTLGRMIYNGMSEFSLGWWLPLMPAAVLLVVTAGLVRLPVLLEGLRRGWE